MFIYFLEAHVTYGEFCEIVDQKIFEDNPRELEGLTPHTDEWYKALVEGFCSTLDSKLLLLDEINEIYVLLLNELDMPVVPIKQLRKDFLSADFILPIHTTKRAERLRFMSFAEPRIKQ